MHHVVCVPVSWGIIINTTVKTGREIEREPHESVAEICCRCQPPIPPNTITNINNNHKRVITTSQFGASHTCDAKLERISLSKASAHADNPQHTHSFVAGTPASSC